MYIVVQPNGRATATPQLGTDIAIQESLKMLNLEHGKFWAPILQDLYYSRLVEFSDLLAVVDGKKQHLSDRVPGKGHSSDTCQSIVDNVNA